MGGEPLAPERYEIVARTSTNIGLATQLGEWAVMDRRDVPWLVELASRVEERLCERRGLRMLIGKTRKGDWPCQRDVGALGDAMGVDRAWLADMLARRGPCSLFLDEVARRQAEEGVWTLELVELGEAIGEVRRRLRRILTACILGGSVRRRW